MKSIAVVMVGYSRPDKLSMSLGRLAQCEGVAECECYLFLDYPFRDGDSGLCEQMYTVAKTMRDTLLPNLVVVRRERNYGVPGNLISAITETFKIHDAVIFFEDDVLVSRTFISYMINALKMYEHDKRIFCINGYQMPMLHVPKYYKRTHDIYLSPRNSAWGFGIWKSRWENVDFSMSDWASFRRSNENMNRLQVAGCDVESMIDAQLAGRIHTWDVQCTYHMAKNNMFAIEPCFSMTKNIGFGKDGFHCSQNEPLYLRQRYYNFNPKLESDLPVCNAIIKQFRYCLVNPTFVGRIYRKIIRALMSFSNMNLDPIDLKV